MRETMLQTSPARLYTLILALCVLTSMPAFAAKKHKASKKYAHVASTKPITKPTKASAYRLRKAKKRADAGGTQVASGPWLEPTFADSTIGDNVDGEDLVVRRAAVDALGPYNGTVLWRIRIPEKYSPSSIKRRPSNPDSNLVPPLKLWQPWPD
jgi:hypothetical protein